jgi:hypothetical protein
MRYYVLMCAITGVADDSASPLCKTESTSSVELAEEAQQVSAVLVDRCLHSLY